ncbi:MAG: AtpZ/AtpI family protein [Alphaproteobacteria bacterium]
MAWRASTDMLAGIVVGTGAGLLCDHFFHTAHWGLIVGFLMGSTAGLLNVYRSLCKVGYGFRKK